MEVVVRIFTVLLCINGDIVMTSKLNFNHQFHPIVHSSDILITVKSVSGLSRLPEIKKLPHLWTFTAQALREAQIPMCEGEQLLRLDQKCHFY